MTLRGDVPVYFGGATTLRTSGVAAGGGARGPSVDALTYLDVRVADRPALGGAPPAVTESTTETTTRDGAWDHAGPLGGNLPALAETQETDPRVGVESLATARFRSQGRTPC